MATTSTRDRIIGTAFELFGRNGFHAIGLDRILEEVGVSKQTFYNHFESKDELILAVLEYRHRVEQQTDEKLMLELAGHDPKKRLYALFDMLDRWFKMPDWHGCIFLNAAAEFPTKTEPAHQAAADHLRVVQEQLQYLATLAGAREPAMLAEQLVVLMEGVIAYQHVTGSERAAAIGKVMAHRLLDEQFAPAHDGHPRPEALLDALPLPRAHAVG
jgi:AcrR family transcriptional regulator